jgi:hypothetical protein
VSYSGIVDLWTELGQWGEGLGFGDCGRRIRVMMSGVWRDRPPKTDKQHREPSGRVLVKLDVVVQGR